MMYDDWRDTATEDYCPECNGFGPRNQMLTVRVGLKLVVLPDGALAHGCYRCGWIVYPDGSTVRTED